MKSLGGHNIWQVTNHQELEARLKAVTRKDYPQLCNLIEQLLNKHTRLLPAVTKAQVKAVNDLKKRFPHFSDYLDWICQSLRFSEACAMPIMIKPHLLIGPPGLGKSVIVRHICTALGLAHNRLNLPDVTANFVLSGMSSSWAGAKPGFIAESLAAGPLPWLILDELDKCGNDTRYPIQPTLLSMLESSTAGEFRDECLETSLDIRPLIFTFTANEIESIDPALLSRLHIVSARQPTPAEMPSIVRSVDVELRHEDPRIAMTFAPLGPLCLRAFAAQSPRSIKHVLARAYLQTLRRGRGQKIRIRTNDIQRAVRQEERSILKRTSIGFHAHGGAHQ